MKETGPSSSPPVVGGTTQKNKGMFPSQLVHGKSEGGDTFAMRYPQFLCLSILILAGCSAATKYDIDEACPAQNFDIYTADSEISQFLCMGKEESQFNIRCGAETVNKIKNVFYCTTQDGKSVRILIKE